MAGTGVAVGLVLFLVGGVPASAQGPVVSVGLQTRFIVANEFPTTITHPKDGSGRLFVGTQNGNIYIFDGTALIPSPFLSIPTFPFGEQGLLGLAFHPGYRDNGWFFVYFTNYNGDSVVARYRVSDSDPNRADPWSGRILLTVAHPYPNHRAGQLAFGPDGFLYIAIGDGGDRLRAPDLTTLAGKILRIDVDTADDSPYQIPPDNPFVGQPPARPEIWALGLRNPWRFSFDRSTGALFIADVGENRYEEVNVTPGTLGGRNYGWPRMEGPLCFEPLTNCNDGTLTLPSFGYGHDATGGCSITGGFRYRGAEFPELDGIYFYGDFCSGRLWGATDSTGSWVSTELRGGPGGSFSTFGEDESGEVYVADYFSGIVFRLVSTAGPTISISDPAPVLESAGEAVFEVTLSAPSERPVSVRYHTTGSAWVLEPQQGQLDFSPGETQKLIRVQILDDQIDEPNTVVSVVLSDPVRATIAHGHGQVTVLDDDPPPVVSVDDCSVLEGDSGTAFCVFTVSLSIQSGFVTKVDSATSDGTAVQGVDYTARSETLFFQPGQTSQTVRVAIRGDVDVESDETFFLNLSLRPDSNLTLGRGQGQGVILNDDYPPPTDPPTLIAPTDTIDTATPTYSWSAVTGASRYLLAVDAPGAGSVSQTEYAASAVCAGSTCSVTPSSLALPEKSYEWRVSAGNKVGWGPPSSPLPFRTDLPPHVILTAAGTGDTLFNGDGRLGFTASLFANAVASDSSSLFVGDFYRIRRVDSRTQLIATIAGTGQFGCTPDGVPAVTANIASVTSLAADTGGNVYLATVVGSTCSQVSRVDQATGIITRVAGNPGPQGFGGDGGPARDAGFAGPAWGLAIDHLGNVLIADTFSRRVRRVDAITGIITTIAGGGGDAGDGGPATAASLLQPRGLAVDGANNIYIAEGNRIRRVDALTGIITTVAGGGVAGFTGDGGPALAARLNGPWGIAVDEGGSLWVADNGNNRVRYIDLARGTIDSAAGNGLTTGAVGDGGPPLNARLLSPEGVAVDPVGNLFIAETFGYRVRIVDNQRPIASAGPDQEIEAGEVLTLDGTSSSDADADPLDFEWWGEDGALLGTGAVITTTLGPGAHAVTVRVRDGHGGMDSDDVMVVVKPAAPPMVSIMSPRDVEITAGVPVTIQWTASDNGTLAGFDVLFASDGGAFDPVPGCTDLPGDARSCTWAVPGPVTTRARLLIEARDRAGHSGADQSSFKIVPPLGNGTGLRGEYYDKRDLTHLVLVRTDPTIDFDWGSGSPAADIHPNTFSVRWTGLIQPRYAETYTFHTVSNEGVRLWVDGRLIIDDWAKDGPRENRGTVTLSGGGKYDIRLEYYEVHGSALVKLLWSSGSEPEQIVPQTQLYPSLSGVSAP